jgi:hypothetical protein
MRVIIIFRNKRYSVVVGCKCILAYENTEHTLCSWNVCSALRYFLTVEVVIDNMKRIYLQINLQRSLCRHFISDKFIEIAGRVFNRISGYCELLKFQETNTVRIIMKTVFADSAEAPFFLA